MIRISRIALSGEASNGRFEGELVLQPGLNIISAPNGYGKSLSAMALSWCLGLEVIHGRPDNDISILPRALHDRIDLEGDRNSNVVSSEVELEFVRDDGAILSLTRSVLGGSPAHVRVEEKSPEGKVVSSAALNARQLTLKDKSGGLQAFLYSWIGLPRQAVTTVDDRESEIYLENLVPLLFVEQLEGWVDLYALQVQRYRQRDISQLAFEYLLGAEGAIKRRLRLQRSLSETNRLKREAEAISHAAVSLLAQRGCVLNWSSRGGMDEISKRWSKRKLAASIRSQCSLDLEEEQTQLKERRGKLNRRLLSDRLDPADATTSSKTTQRVLDLKNRSHRVKEDLRTVRSQLVEQERVLASIESRILATSDVLRLKRSGIGRLSRVECPTCHRDLDVATFHLTRQSAESVEVHLESLDRDRLLVKENTAQLRAEVTRLSGRALSVDTELSSAQRALAIVNSAADPIREQLGKAAADLAEVDRQLERNSDLRARLTELQEQIDRWLKEAAELRGDEPSDSDIVQRKESFLRSFRANLLALGHTAITVDNIAKVSLDERYLPYLGSRRLRSLGSASDHPRLIAAFTVALAAASAELSAPHPGFVVLDEPMQQNPDEEHREKIVKFLVDLGSRELPHQVVILTNLRSDELSRIRGEGVGVTSPEGVNLLRASTETLSPDVV